MVLELVVERYKRSEREAGIKIGKELGRSEGRLEGRLEGRSEGRMEERQATHAWYERQQAAFRAGLPFDEPPPGYDPKGRGNGKAAD